MRHRIIIHFGELTLKGQNRREFVKKLRQNVSRKLRAMSIGDSEGWTVRSIHDRMFVEVPENHQADIEPVLRAIAEVPGIAWLTHVYWFSAKHYDLFHPRPDLAFVDELVEKLGHETHRKGASFAVRVKRADKRFALGSKALEQRLATVLLKNTPWKKVDLKHADQFFYVEISSRGLAVFTNRIKGAGGLPVSSTGRVLTLLSGGFDSPVAAWLMTRRGCNIDLIHFTASHVRADDLESYKVSRIARRLSEIAGKVRLIMVPYTHFDLALMDKGLDYDLMLFRRFMARVAARVADELRAQALVTGDNLGQVASQTLENIVSMTKSIDYPILRPLLTYDKDEIIAHSQHLGLFEICKEPYKDCCALISNNPKTRTYHDRLQAVEERFFPEYQELVQQTLDERQQLTYIFGQRQMPRQPQSAESEPSHSDKP